jgi:predicted adenylyl cyclase CyaB
MSTPDGGSPVVGLRVRRETQVSPDGEASGVCVVTFKTKQKWDGIEINEENEFTVSDGDVFSTLLGRLGFREDYHKHKTGDRWVVDGVTAELAEVGDDRRSLGVFLELEIITDESDPGVVESAGARLFALLAGCGVGKDRIESRYYEELLRS